ncbi:asparaginase [Candidatus Erwinia haradaeae]|uniref:L-asparaginase 1 n=1 Tax=Candidatus Erwinia haradaeae TaxID=1922217 RepID=A0A451D1I3_9GAMM|nr:asparaginase [Candidatus Erwinia haradaeae]VFP79472.1 L-asparaginase 1 [Candidatus Erwinia haradaeae]
MQKKNIYVAYTGGTIGMKQSRNGFIPVSGYLQNQLLNTLEFHREEMPYFVLHEYQPLIDSADMTPNDWQSIANDIRRNYHAYDGFVILHGTDTMAFTASALSFILENLSKPVIITGSQIPLEQMRSDGHQNLLNALFIAARHPIHEVTLFFNNVLYRGNRTTKVHANGLNAFASPNLSPLLEVGTNIKCLNTPPAPLGIGELIVHQITPQEIGLLTIYPGMSSTLVRNFMKHPIKALIIRSYGIGNAPQNKEFLKVVEEATQCGILVVNLTQCMSGKINMRGYTTGHALKNIGVVSGSDLTVEAALTKLYYLLSQNLSIHDMRNIMQKNLRGELTLDEEK